MTTLLTHEWLRTRSMLGSVAGIAALVAGLATLFTVTGWPVLSEFGFVLGFITIAVLVPALQLLLVADFWRSSYSRTGYFTHALPIRGGRIYAAKLIWAFIVTLAALVITLALLAGFWPAAASRFGAEPNPFVAVRDLWAQLSAAAPTALLIGGLVLTVAMYLVWPILYYFSVSIGSEGRLNRLGLGGPVLVFVGLYVAYQVITMVSLIVIPVGLDMASDSLALVRFNFLDGGDVLPLGIVPAIVVIAVICLLRTVWSWNRKISLA